MEPITRSLERNRWLVVLLGTLFLWTATATIPGITFANTNRGDAGEGELSLRRLLAEAEHCAPAFLSVHDLVALADLAERQKDADRQLSGRFEVGIGVEGSPFRVGGQALISARWPITENLTLSADKALDGADGKVQATWNRVVWPIIPAEPKADHMEALELLGARFQAERGVITAFQQAQSAATEWTLAQKSALIAQERFAQASHRFAAGEMALSTWRSEEDLLMQAEEQVRAANRSRQDALWDLAEVLFGGCMSPANVFLTADDQQHNFADDLDWDALVTAVLERLQLAEHLPEATIRMDIAAMLDSVDPLWVNALIEQFDPSAQRAHLQLQQSERTATIAAQEALPKVAGTANMTQPLSGDSPLSWHVGVGLTVDWSGSAKIQAERARIDERAAERELESVLRRVHRDGARAFERISEALANVEAREQAVERAQEAARIIELRVETGFLMQLDLDEAQLAVARAMAQREQAIDELKLAWLDLAFRLGLLPGDLVR